MGLLDIAVLPQTRGAPQTWMTMGRPPPLITIMYAPFPGSILNHNSWFSNFMQEMRQIRNWLALPQTHEDMSMVAFNIITHGSKDGWLRSADKEGEGLHTHDIVGTLTDVETLRGKPKLLFLNACRGGKMIFTGVSLF